MLTVVAVVFCVIVMLNGSSSTHTTFSEELLIRPLENGRVLAHFQFETVASLPKKTHHFQSENYGIFPKSIGQILDKFQVEEMHLSLTQGRWLEIYGTPIASAPVGAELWAYFSGESSKSVGSAWMGLQEALAAIFCASLNQIQEIQTSIPSTMFEPEGNAFLKEAESVFELRYGTLPRENVCTENLTPWLKLLPCGKHAGFGMLLNPLKAFNSQYQSLQAHAVQICTQIDDGVCTKRAWKFTESLSLVLDPFSHDKEPGWTFEQLFGAKSTSACPIASESYFYLQLTKFTKAVFPNFHQRLDMSPSDFHKESDDLEFKINQPPMKVYDRLQYQLLEYDLLKLDEFNFEASWSPNWSFVSQTGGLISPLPLKSQRYFTGEGLHFGGVTVNIINSDPERTFKIAYFDTYPWYMKVYFHTLKIWLNGKLLDRTSDLSFTFMPAEYRSRPTIFEFITEIPPKSTLLITFEFEKTFLTMTEFPPDYNRGFDIGSSVITLLNTTDDIFGLDWSPRSNRMEAIERTHLLRLYTTQLLLLLPSPDMSMPFNVIAFTCTVLAFFFGSVFNILYKTVEEQENRTTVKRFEKLGDKLKQLRDKVVGKFRRKQSSEYDESTTTLEETTDGDEKHVDTND